MAFGFDDAILLSFQAAGAIYSFSQANSNQKLIRKGRELEKSAFESNLETLRLQSSEESLNEMQALRENVANQIAINAARGVSSGAGSGARGIEKSEQVFNRDEKVRRMNLLVKENQLRANDVLSGLHTLTSETKLGQSLTNQLFQNLPVSSLLDTFKGSSTDKGVWGASAATKGATKKAGFGLDTI